LAVALAEEPAGVVAADEVDPADVPAEELAPEVVARLMVEVLAGTELLEAECELELEMTPEVVARVTVEVLAAGAELPEEECELEPELELECEVEVELELEADAELAREAEEEDGHW